jgi:hypothetical protein
MPTLLSNGRPEGGGGACPLALLPHNLGISPRTSLLEPMSIPPLMPSQNYQSTLICPTAALGSPRPMCSTTCCAARHSCVTQALSLVHESYCIMPARPEVRLHRRPAQNAASEWRRTWCRTVHCHRLLLTRTAPTICVNRVWSGGMAFARAKCQWPKEGTPMVPPLSVSS